jgi:hypothetical protein
VLCAEVQLLPGERVCPVELVGPLRVARIAVHRDADEVARDRLGAGIAELPPLDRVVPAPVVVQLGVVVLDDEAAGLLVDVPCCVGQEPATAR